MTRQARRETHTDSRARQHDDDDDDDISGRDNTQRPQTEQKSTRERMNSYFIFFFAFRAFYINFNKKIKAFFIISSLYQLSPTSYYYTWSFSVRIMVPMTRKCEV